MENQMVLYPCCESEQQAICGSMFFAIHPITDQGLIPIGSIVAGDRVLNKNGDYDIVESVQVAMYTGSMSSITTNFAGKPLIMTPEHQILTIQRPQKEVDLVGMAKRVELNILKPTYKCAKELREGDLVGIPKIRCTIDVPSLSCEDLRMTGLLLACGTYDPDTMEYTLQLPKTMMALQALVFIETYLSQFGITDPLEKEKTLHYHNHWKARGFNYKGITL